MKNRDDDLVTKGFLSKTLSEFKVELKNELKDELRAEIKFEISILREEMKEDRREMITEIKQHNSVLLEEFQSRMLALGEFVMNNTARIVVLENKVL